MSNAAKATVCPIKTCFCQVSDVTPLTAEAYQVELQAPAEMILDYHAGQYLQLELDLNRDGALQSLYYSIANNCKSEQPGRLQLFIHKTGELVNKILKHLSEVNENNGKVKVTLPMGQAFLQTNLSFTHVLIAAGSGISKIKCITEEILKRQPDADVNVYWSNKKADDFYLLDEFQGWEEQCKSLNFTPILESADASWSGRSGYIYKVIKEEFEDLSESKVYLCGSSKMVYGTIDQLNSIGLKNQNCYSDVFEYAPRAQKMAI